MSLSTIDVIMDRIRAAKKESPIAIFATPIKYKGKLNAVFRRTIKTQRLIDNKDPLLISTFNNTMDEEKIKKMLTKKAQL